MTTCGLDFGHGPGHGFLHAKLQFGGFVDRA
jgi:hypothetical protein